MKSSTLVSGFVLVESLVAILLLSVALAGSAALFVHALRSQFDAACRGVAQRQAESLAEQLRALTRSDGEPLQSITMPDAGFSCPMATRDCAVEEYAAAYLDTWTMNTLALLPDGSEAIVRAIDATTPTYQVRISWTPDGEATGTDLLLAFST